MENHISFFKDINVVSADLIKEKVKFIETNISEFTDNEIKTFINYLRMDKRKKVQELAVHITHFIEKRNCEIKRVAGMYEFDKKYARSLTLAGTDEVGRGPLAGPIVAAAVILDLNYEKNSSLILGIKDSKKLTPKLRDELSAIIKEKALYYNIAVINNKIIDEQGISWSNNEVLLRASSRLKFKPDIVLSDGYAVKNIEFENHYIIKGDAKSASIACASILAKVYRDNLMKEYSKIYPIYGFENNMGYGTQEHIDALRKYGPCEIHRLYFLKNII